MRHQTKEVCEEANTMTPAPAPAPTYGGEMISKCCMGSPGAVYLVACIVDEYPTEELYTKIKFSTKTKFDGRCVQADGLCGSACGYQTSTPSKEVCEFDAKGIGRINRNYLFNTKDTDDEFKLGRKSTVYTKQYRNSSILSDTFHTFFILFMSITVISMWISFLPGIGYVSKNICDNSWSCPDPRFCSADI